MTVSAPYGGRRPYNWPSLLLALGGYVVTFLGFWQVIRHRPDAAPLVLTTLGLVHLVVALVLMLCTLWMIAFAYGFRARTTILQGVTAGMLADLLMLRGLREFYGVHSPEAAIELTLLGIAALSLILLVTGNNTENLRREREEREVQETDVLTGLYNRLGVGRRYAELAPADLVTVVMIDLNDLKLINDLGGHSLGDGCLRALAQALRGGLPPGAFVGRWGGDEFVAVLPGHADTAPIFRALRLPVQGSVQPTFAYGGAQVTAGTPLGRALALADQKMYEDKAAARAPDGVAEAAGVGVADFPHFLLSLNSQADIVGRGLSRAAELAGFENWFYAEAGTLKLVCRPPGRPEQAALLQEAVGTPGSMIDQVLRGGRTLWAADYERSPYAQDTWVRGGLKSVVMTPVLEHGEVRGVVSFFSHQTWHSVTPKARQLLGAVATHLGHQLERDTVLGRLEASVEVSLTGLGHVLEARDLETAGHTERVVALALSLGAAAGLSGAEMHALRLGAYLHDVGKLAVPDRVLLKPGALDGEEWRLMQTHSEEGARMAARIPALPPAVVEIVRSHHERWDGRGYPQGLAGEAVPYLARIFALCDVYDALVHVRPYKPAWTPEAARAELAAQAGRQFDPALTELFLREVLGPAPRPAALAHAAG